MKGERQIFLTEEFQKIYVDLALQKVEFNSPCSLGVDGFNDFLSKNKNVEK